MPRQRKCNSNNSSRSSNSNKHSNSNSNKDSRSKTSTCLSQWTPFLQQCHRTGTSFKIWEGEAAMAEGEGEAAEKMPGQRN